MPASKMLNPAVGSSNNQFPGSPNNQLPGSPDTQFPGSPNNQIPDYLIKQYSLSITICSTGQNPVLIK